MIIMNLTLLLYCGLAIRISNEIYPSTFSSIQYSFQIMFSMVMLAMMFILVPRAQASAVRVNEVLEIEPEIVDAKNVEACFKKKGYIEFKNVSFSYHGAEEPAIKNISFSAKPGEVTAIIGSTGVGKSTLVNMIPRFYDVGSGSVLIDGVDVRDISQECLRSKIGFVPQKAFLFSGTIAENIRFGNKEANMSEVKHAAKVAQATEFIDELEKGFDHEIEQGNVSGGQNKGINS